MEVFAAQLAFQDYQFGRILDELKASGKLDDTIIVFVQCNNRPARMSTAGRQGGHG